jgi:hypothetical protein
MGNDNPATVDHQLIDMLNAFQNSIKASLETILQIDSEELDEILPQGFILDYCSIPLERLSI